MYDDDDRNYVSIKFWLLSFIVMAIPLVNIIMTLVWAFSGENESRKNYFKALIVLWVALIAMMFAVFFGLEYVGKLTK